MPRNREVVEIDGREFTIKELTVGQIIDLTTNTKFFGGTLQGTGDEGKEQSGEVFAEELALAISDFKILLEYCADFTFEDLHDLTPSQVRQIYDGFKKANSDFLSTLKALGIAEMLVNIRDAIVERFSLTLATSLKADM
jgi:hypothetical protein